MKQNKQQHHGGNDNKVQTGQNTNISNKNENSLNKIDSSEDNDFLANSVNNNKGTK